MQTDKSCGFRSSFICILITNAIKVELTNLESVTKEGINQLKTTALYLSQKILTPKTKLVHSKEDPVVEVMEKVKHTEKQNKIMRFQRDI